MLEKSADSNKVPLLPDEQFPTGPTSQLGSNGQGLPDDSLESAIHDIERDARTTGEEPFRLRQAAADARSQGFEGEALKVIRNLAEIEKSSRKCGTGRPQRKTRWSPLYLSKKVRLSGGSLIGMLSITANVPDSEMTAFAGLRSNTATSSRMKP